MELGPRSHSQTLSGNLGDLARPHLDHDLAQLAFEDVDDGFDALLSEGGQAPEIRPADTHGRRPERQRLEQVGASPEAAIDQQRDTAAHGGRDLGEGFDAGEAGVFRATAVVRHEDPVDAVLDTALGIPADLAQLDIDRQAEYLEDRLKSQFGISNVQELKDPEVVDAVLKRFQILAGINQNFAATSSASTALVLLGNAAAGFGAVASQNLFLSGF